MKKNKILSITILFLLSIIYLLFLLFVIYLLFLTIFNQDYENYQIDKYNFEQLEKAKIILEKIPEDANNFHTLKAFNEIYSAGIEPIKNCYYIANKNGRYPYIFGFKLESIIYKIRYLKNYYAYPKYDLPIHYICIGGKSCDYDVNKGRFRLLISRSCSE